MRMILFYKLYTVIANSVFCHYVISAAKCHDNKCGMKLELLAARLILGQLPISLTSSFSVCKNIFVAVEKALSAAVRDKFCIISHSVG